MKPLAKNFFLPKRLPAICCPNNDLHQCKFANHRFQVPLVWPRGTTGKKPSKGGLAFVRRPFPFHTTAALSLNHIVFIQCKNDPEQGDCIKLIGIVNVGSAGWVILISKYVGCWLPQQCEFLPSLSTFISNINSVFCCIIFSRKNHLSIKYQVLLFEILSWAPICSRIAPWLPLWPA